MTNLVDSKQSKDVKKEANNRKITHLYLNDKYLSAITNLNGYINLTVLYLHNNAISKIQNLHNLLNLRNLYLQRNKIAKIENLNTLTKLQRLYLGHNEISVIENLENLKQLEELHIEKQNLENGDKLCIDPRSIYSLMGNLEVLNISGNNLCTIQMLAPLKYLRLLNASNNSITKIENITDTLEVLARLKEAHFGGNPVSKEHRYKESIIAKAIRLRQLDGKEIADNTRSFIKRFEIEKMNFGNRDVIKFPKDISNMAKNYPLSLQKAVSNFMLKPSKPSDVTTFAVNTSEAYVPWKCMPSSFVDNNSKIPPALRKNKKRTRARIMNLSSLPNLL